MSLDCLNDIIGIRPTDCTCWDSSKPVDFNALNTSTSGLYVAEPNTITIRWTNSASDCENGGIWDLLAQSLYGSINPDTGERNGGAIRDTLESYLVKTAVVKKERFEPFTTIGDNYFKQAETVKASAVVAGFYIEPYELRGANLSIESIDIAFYDGILGATPVNIEVYSSLNLTTPIASATANVTANQTFATASFLSPITIDLGSIRRDLNERIYFVYTIPAGTRPVKNNIEIGCKCSKARKVRNNPWLAISCTNGGFQSTSVADVLSPISQTSTMQGLRLNASLECDYYSWMCDLAQKPKTISGTTNRGERLMLGMTLADTIRAKAVVNLVNSILKSSRINLETMTLGKEVLYKTRSHFQKIFDKGIDNLVYYMPADVSDCLVCADDKRMRKAQILV